MAKEQKSNPGWLDRAREKKREKQLRAGPSPEKLAERSKRDGISLEEDAGKATRGGQFLGPYY